MRQPLVVGNWKMNGSLAANVSLLSELKPLLANTNTVTVAICAPFVYLAQLSSMTSVAEVGGFLEGSFKVGAQDVSIHLDGAYTGEVSAAMLADLGCEYVIIGHSERREYHHESNLLVAQKALAAQRAGLIPIVCVGETLAQRKSNDAMKVIGEQLNAVKSVLGDSVLAQCVIAYEPVWAIGTGLTATPEQAQEIHQFIRATLGSTGENTQILYGGSVKPDNAKNLFEQADIGGALVGGASLNAQDFFNIVLAANTI